MKKTILFFAFAFFAFAFKSDAQNYKTAAGARFGYPLSASIKHFLNDSHALEAYIGTRGYSGYRWTNISAAYQIHNPISSVDGLQYYYGAGASIFFWNFKSSFLEPASTTTFGIQGYLGLDYTFADVPVSLTVDWVPTYFLNGFGDGFGGGFGSLGVRYIFAE